MVDMTAELAFQARELSESGIWSGRIAEILGVREQDVRRALSGDQFEEPVREAARPPAPVPAPKPRRVDPTVWPAPVDASTEWETVRVGSGPDRGADVRVRWVQLWGKRVRINYKNEVYCHHCLSFRTTKQLGHPYNSCPVGLPHRGGIVPIDFDEEDAVCAPVRARRFVDFLRVPM